MKKITLFFSWCALTSSCLGAQTATDLAGKLTPLYEAKAYNYEELARIQKRIAAYLDEWIKETRQRQDEMQTLASKLEQMQENHQALIQEFKDVKTWTDLGKAYSVHMEDFPNVDPKKLEALQKQFDSVKTAQEFTAAIAAKFSLLASVATGAQQKAYQKVADSLRTATGTDSAQRLYDALSEYYDDKEVESSALQKAYQSTSKSLSK